MWLLKAFVLVSSAASSVLAVSVHRSLDITNKLLQPDGYAREYVLMPTHSGAPSDQ